METILPLHKEEIESLISRRMESKPDILSVEGVDYTVDYKNSTVKNEKALTYLSTLKIKSKLKIDYTIPVEERMDLLSFYMDSNRLAYNESLISCISVMLLEDKEQETEGDFWLTKEERKQFKLKWKDVYSPWVEFMDNLVPMLPFTSILFKEGIGNELIEKGEVEVVDDHLFLGLNCIYALLQEGFVETYQSLNGDKKTKNKYFQVQMEQSIFNGKSLPGVLASADISVFVFMAAIFNSCEGKDDFEGLFKEAI